MTFKTHGVLSVTTDCLMGDISAVYEVASYLLDRPAFTHELGHYAERMKCALLTCHPELPLEATRENWEKVRDSFISKHGATMNLDPALKGVLADGKDPTETLREMGFTGQIIVR